MTYFDRDDPRECKCGHTAAHHDSGRECIEDRCPRYRPTEPAPVVDLPMVTARRGPSWGTDATKGPQSTDTAALRAENERLREGHSILREGWDAVRQVTLDVMVERDQARADLDTLRAGVRMEAIDMERQAELTAEFMKVKVYRARAANLRALLEHAQPAPVVSRDGGQPADAPLTHTEAPGSASGAQDGSTAGGDTSSPTEAHTP